VNRLPKRQPKRPAKRPVSIRYKAEINPSYEWLGDARDIGVSHRELEVLALAIEGYTNKEIAEILHIEHQSVKNHMYKLMQKLGVKNGMQAVVIALSMNLIKWRATAGDFKVEIDADGFLENFKWLLDGKDRPEGSTTRSRRALNAKLLSHGIDVDKLNESKKA